MKLWEVTWLDNGTLYRSAVSAFDLYAVLNQLPTLGYNAAPWNVVKIEQVNRIGQNMP